MTEKQTKPAAKRPRSRKPKAGRPEPTHGQISERAYYIHLTETGCDPLANWLRAERELQAA